MMEDAKMKRQAVALLVLGIGLAGLVAATVTLALQASPASGQALRLNTPAPEVVGGPWIGSAPLSMEKLRGRVVLVEFWTYG